MLRIDADGYQYAQKDPDADLDYVWDWAPLTNGRAGARTDWLASGETISSTFSVTAESGLTLGTGAKAAARTDGNTSVTAWLMGGTAGQTYEVRCRITTSAGRTDDRTLRVQVVER
jgi:hypothetical protein